MRKGMWSAAAAVVLLSGAGAALTVSGALAADNTVTMKDLYFEPADITVAVNTPVVFHNGSGSLSHDAKAVDNSFSTPMLAPGKDATVTLTKVGDVKYYCTVEGHRSAGMEATIHVTAAGGGPAPTPSVTTATTQPGSATTATTAQTTTTTAKGAGGASSTTTTTAGTGVTATTQAASVTPTSAPDTAAESTTTTVAGQAGGEEAAADHNSEGAHKKKKAKNSPIGIAFAAVSTLLLTGIAGKLLASKP